MTFEQITLYVILPVIAYLLGSVPFAFVIGKAHGVDIRTVGSKNIGATNLGRTLGKKYFWQAFFLDALKGFLPALVASLLMHRQNELAAPHGIFYPQNTWGPVFPSWVPLLSAIAAVVGHLFPVWLKFKGGKGVATGFGAVLGIWPLYTMGGVVGAVFFVFTLFVYRYISLASMVGAFFFAAAVTYLAFNDVAGFKTSLAGNNWLPIVATAWLFVAMIVWRHRTNIGRLMKGTESRIGQGTVDKAKLK